MKKRFETKKAGIIKKIKSYNHKEIIIFVLVLFVIYLSTLSCSLDDEDSIFFIRGIREFDVTKWQPHPPGYPIYILLGKISVFLIGEELLGLTILSAIFGALSLVVFYFLIFEMFNKKTALMATMILGVTPLFWLSSLKAMTDIVGVFFVLLSMYFIYKFIKYKKIKSLYTGSLVSGLSVGLRFHSFFIVFPLLIYAIFNIKYGSKPKKKNKKANHKKILCCLAMFFVGILLWLIPILIINGFFGYFDAVSKQFFKRFEPGFAVVGGGISMDYLVLTMKDSFNLFLGSSYGFNFLGFKVLPAIVLLIYLFFLLLSCEKLKDKRILFFIVGLFFYLTMVILFLPLSNSRYFLPLIPFISLLFSLGISWFGKFDYLAFIFLIFLLIFSSVPLVKGIHSEITPPVKLVDYVKENYDLDKIIIFRDSMTGRHLKYYSLPSYFYVGLIAYLSNESISDQDPVDRNKIISAVFDKNKIILVINPTPYFIMNYNMTLIKKFDRDIRIHAKHSSIQLYELDPS